MNEWRATKGYKPNTSAENVFVRYRCGLESKQAYSVASQRWTHEGADFDIVAYRVPEEWQAAA